MNYFAVTGRITHEPELKTSASGTEYTNISIAVDRRKKDKDGNKQTDFVKATIFGKQAVLVTTFFKKGDGILVSGRCESDKYTDKNGVERIGWTLMAENVEFLPGKGKASSDGAVSAPTELTGSDRDLPF